jgi:hypothetical protein
MAENQTATYVTIKRRLNFSSESGVSWSYYPDTIRLAGNPRKKLSFRREGDARIRAAHLVQNFRFLPVRYRI